jgi:hypothetical protein
MNKWIIICSFVALFGCSDPFIDLPDGRSTLVVEGWVTDQSKQHWVKVSRATRFNDSQPEIIVSNASVTIEDSQGQAFPLTFDEESGQYLSTIFAGNGGDSYMVKIILQDGEELASTWESIIEVPPIDDLQFESFDDTDPETGEDIVVYYPVVTSLDPISQQNQYRYKGYKNGTLLNTPEELVLLSDEFNNGQSLPHHIPEFRLSLNDQITIELHSLSSPAFQFLALLRAQTTSLGSSSGTAPAKLIGNLSYTNRPNDIILGFFGASSIKTATSQVSE